MSYSGMDFSHAQLDVFLVQFGPKSPLARPGRLWLNLAELFALSPTKFLQCPKSSQIVRVTAVVIAKETWI